MAESNPKPDASPADPVPAVESSKDEEELQVRFSPEEEKALLDESNTLKTEANALFSSAQYTDAIAKYDSALQSCPNYLHFERAVLQSNVAAAHLKLSEWPEAIKSASTSLELLTKLETEQPDLSEPPSTSDRVTELPDDHVEPSKETLSRRADIRRIRTKALLRRARGRSEAGGWQNLAGAEEDYKALAQNPAALTAADLKTVAAQLRALPPRTKAAQEKEMSEMWGKLKGLGDGILKPFGLSTDNFKMVKDEATGGYSVNFSQDGPGGPKS